MDTTHARLKDARDSWYGMSTCSATSTSTEQRVGNSRHFSVVRPRHCEALTLLPE